MRYTLRLSALAAALLSIVAAPASAQIDDKHQRLMAMSVADISEEIIANPDDLGALGHVFLRCSIMSNIMAQMIPAAMSDSTPDDARTEMQRMTEEYEANHILFLGRGSQAIEMPAEEIIELHQAMFETWSPELTQSAAQLFRRNEEGSTPWRAGQAFLAEISICNETAKQL